MTVYALLNKEAKEWWAHRDLRKAGKHQEARAKERSSIRDRVRNLRECYWFSVGRGGFTLHGRFIPHKDGGGGMQGKLQGYGKGEVYAECLRLALPHIPRVDSTTASNENIFLSLRFPMPQDRPSEWDEPKEDGSYNSMMYCPLGIVLACHESIGSTVHWGDLDADEWRAKAQPTLARVHRKNAA